MLKQSTVHLDAKQEALQTCENAQTTYSKEAKRQSAEQLAKEEAKRLNTQRTEDEYQCVNQAKLLRHGEWSQHGEDKAQCLQEKESKSQKKIKNQDFFRITMLNGSSWSYQVLHGV